LELRGRCNGKQIRPASDIRVLGVRIDTALKWQAHLRTIEARATRMINAIKSLTGSTWGFAQRAGVTVYTSMIRPAITYGASAWYAPEGITGARKGVVNKLKAIQGKYLRIITGAYKATATEALEVETHILPIDIVLETTVAKTILRLSASPASSEVELATKRIRQQMRSKRGKQAHTRKTLGRRKEQWVREQVGDLKKAAVGWKEIDPPWGKTASPEQRSACATRTALLNEAYERVKKKGKEKWEKRWKEGKKGQHLKHISPEPTQENRKLHAGYTKPHSALLTQLRTGKIGFKEFLYNRKVPGIYSKQCTCGYAAMSVQHILMACPNWARLREQEIGRTERDIRVVLGTKEGATAAIRMILKTGLLGQFKAVTREEQAESRRNAGERQERARRDTDQGRAGE
jgi:hypothetical protein